MARSIALTLALCFAPLAASTADVYRWVDDDGKTHYGDTIPEKYKPTAKKVGAEDPKNPAQRRESEDRVAREKDKLEALQRERNARQQQPSPPPAAAQAPAQAGSDCEEQMKRYLASLECFAPYTISNGAIKSEAFEKCQVVTQPKGCFAPTQPSERTY